MAEGNSVVDRNVIRVRLKDTDQAEAIAHYLDGVAGYGLRQILLQGSAAPTLRVNDLARLPISVAALEDMGRRQTQLPLDVQLEQALWRS